MENKHSHNIRLSKKTNEYKYDMKVSNCENCGCLQVNEVPNKNLMF